ncbi:MAG: hypothetical protein KatS3mg091_146 [Patescibacteria group bacterium]|nr:MAG: hypothetical protein KatS3mg091_146 [Patescibacteria group bacterium]
MVEKYRGDFSVNWNDEDPKPADSGNTGKSGSEGDTGKGPSESSGSSSDNNSSGTENNK